jgi:hypothetical protein
MLRSFAVVCAAVLSTVAVAQAETAAAPGCAETTFRVYFQHDSAALDPSVEQMLDVASRGVAQCGYAELRVTVDASSPYAEQRAEAIEAAADGRDWDAVRIEPRTLHRAANGGPEYAEVTMTPNASTAAPRPLPDRTDTGV